MRRELHPMIELPIDPILPEIIANLREARSVVVVAEPGAGKTTRVPPAILRAGLLISDHPNLVMLQPRRVAARAAAHRIAEEQGWTVGHEVGYQVRFEKRIGPQTRLRVLTEGILTRQLLDDPELRGVGCVILDEFHERSLHTDLAIALLHEVRQSLRDDLLLVVMSATLAAEPVARFLGECPVLRAEGRTFPVEIRHVTPTGGRLPERVADTVVPLVENESEGHVLVFLPGADEIRRTMRLLEPRTQQFDLDILPLHGSLPFEQQIRALQPSTRRKLILATNIAETSLTIEGVTTVIDSGYARIAGYDPQRGLDRLELKRISKASADQRAGRAGRIAPGRCIRLWSSKEHHALEEFEQPEIKRVDLCGTVLALHAWGQSDPRQFGWFEPPPDELLAAAEQLLAMLGALTSDTNARITPLGKRLLALPVHPRIGRLLLASADAGRGEEGAAMAAILEEKDFVAPSSRDFQSELTGMQGDSDLLVRMQILQQRQRRHAEGIDTVALRHVARTRDQLLRIAQRSLRWWGRHSCLPRGEAANHLGPSARGRQECLPHQRSRSSNSEDELLRWPLLAYPDRVCRRRANDPMSGVMVGGGGVRLSPDCVVRRGDFLVALDARHDQRSAAREALVRMASRIEVQWLEELFAQSIRRERTVVFDESRQRVVARGTVWYRDLLLREDRDAPVDPQQAGKVLAEALRSRARELIESDEKALAWLARVRFLAQAMPKRNYPTFDDAMLADVIAEACQGKGNVEEVRSASLVALLQARLPHQLLRLIDEHAPEAIEVPSGSRIRLNYNSGQKPILAVRLQEIFGWTETPRIAAGRVSILLHILGPNFRPVQITDDLQSFWNTTYAHVRKDLRVRYPKHSWPQDPFKARPEAKGGRRR